MYKKIIGLSLAILTFFSFFTPVYAAEETLGDLRSTYNELLKQKQENDNLSAEAKAEIREQQ